MAVVVYIFGAQIGLKAHFGGPPRGTSGTSSGRVAWFSAPTVTYRVPAHPSSGARGPRVQTAEPPLWIGGFL